MANYNIDKLITLSCNIDDLILKTMNILQKNYFKMAH